MFNSSSHQENANKYQIRLLHTHQNEKKTVVTSVDRDVEKMNAHRLLVGLQIGHFKKVWPFLKWLNIRVII